MDKERPPEHVNGLLEISFGVINMTPWVAMIFERTAKHVTSILQGKGPRDRPISLLDCDAADGTISTHNMQMCRGAPKKGCTLPPN